MDIEAAIVVLSVALFLGILGSMTYFGTLLIARKRLPDQIAGAILNAITIPFLLLPLLLYLKFFSWIFFTLYFGIFIVLFLKASPVVGWIDRFFAGKLKYLAPIALPFKLIGEFLSSLEDNLSSNDKLAQFFDFLLSLLNLLVFSALALIYFYSIKGVLPRYWQFGADAIAKLGLGAVELLGVFTSLYLAYIFVVGLMVTVVAINKNIKKQNDISQKILDRLELLSYGFDGPNPRRVARMKADAVNIGTG